MKNKIEKYDEEEDKEKEGIGCGRNDVLLNANSLCEDCEEDEEWNEIS